MASNVLGVLTGLATIGVTAWALLKKQASSGGAGGLAEIAGGFDMVVGGSLGSVIDVDGGSGSTGELVFIGQVTNSGNTDFTGVLQVDAFSGDVSLRVNGLQISIPAGEQRAFNISVDVFEADPPGLITATATVFNEQNQLVDVLTSQVLGSIEGVPVITLSGGFSVTVG